MNEPLHLLDLKRQYAMHSERFEQAMREVCANAQFIMGPALDSFEKNFAGYVGTGHAIGVASGTDALRLACEALHLGPGDEVLYPANTFIATALAVRQVGATPIPVDVGEDHLMDLDDLRAKANSRTKAIIPVHLYGQALDMGALMDIADELGLAVIEDACQAHGAKWNGTRCGGFGHLGCFSFYPGKNLGAFGDGGMVTTNDDALARAILNARNYGQSAKYVHDSLGGNSRLDALQAAVLDIKLAMLDDWNAARFEAALEYTRLLEGSSVEVPLFDQENPHRHVFHLYVVLCDDREGLMQHMAKRGIHCGIHYPVPVHLQKAMADLGHHAGACPKAEALAPRLLSLPIFPEIRKDEIERVAAAIREFNGDAPLPA